MLPRGHSWQHKSHRLCYKQRQVSIIFHRTSEELGSFGSFLKPASRNTSLQAGDMIHIPDGRVPSVTSVAVGISSNLMKPSPVGIDDDRRSGSCTSTCGTLTNSERRVDLSSVGANLLGASDCQKASGGEE